MTHRLLHSSLAAVLVLSLAPALRAQAPAAMDAEQGWSAVGRCAAISNERARHDCLDDVLRNAGLLTRQAEATERRRQFGATAPAAPPAPSAAPAAPASAPASASVPAAAAPRVEAVDRLEAAIATIVKGADGKLVLTTTEGAVWRQTDSDTIPRLPAAGEIVRIRKASFSSFLCELPSHHTFRCTRTK